MAQMKKKDIIQILVEKYGYEEDELKEYTLAKLKEILKKEEDDEQFLELQSNVATFNDNELILVMNGLDGGLTHRSITTGRIWRFTQFGQVDKMPYHELVSINNMNPKVFTQGWLIILNKDVVQHFGLTEIYKNILTPKNIDEVFKKSIDELNELIDKLPLGMKQTLINRARQLYQERKIDSISLVRFLEEKFGFSFEDNAPLDDVV